MSYKTNHKMKAMLIVALLFGLFIVEAAGAPEIEWSRTFGGKERDGGFYIQQTSDGGYIIRGWTESYGAGGSDIWLIKTDSKGNEQWNKTFGGREDEQAFCIQQTSDGYFIGGSTSSIAEDRWTIWLIKTDSKGNEQWNKTVETKKGTDLFNGKPTKDGGFIFCGTTREPAPDYPEFAPGYPELYERGIVIKVDSQGNKEWEKIVSDIFPEEWYEWSKSRPESLWIWDVTQTSDGGYIITGDSNPLYPAPPIFIVKLDPKGNLEWQKTFGGGEKEGMDRLLHLYFGGGFAIAETDDGGYILTGYTGGELFVIRTDSKGNEIWNMFYEEEKGGCGRAIQQTKDGGYIIAGYTGSPYGWDESDLLLIKLKPE